MTGFPLRSCCVITEEKSSCSDVHVPLDSLLLRDHYRQPLGDIGRTGYTKGNSGIVLFSPCLRSGCYVSDPCSDFACQFAMNDVLGGVRRWRST